MKAGYILKWIFLIGILSVANGTMAQNADSISSLTSLGNIQKDLGSPDWKPKGDLALTNINAIERDMAAKKKKAQEHGHLLNPRLDKSNLAPYGKMTDQNKLVRDKKWISTIFLLYFLVFFTV